MIIKYFHYKKKELFFVGFAWMAIYQPWWSGTFVFLMNIFNIVNGAVNPGLYILIGTMFIPVTSFSWFMGITEMLFQKYRKLIVGFYVCVSVLMDILIATLIFMGFSDQLAHIEIVDADYRSFMIIYLMFINSSVAITCFLIGRISIKSQLPQVKLRGKFLIAASICYFLGGLLDVGLIEFIPELLIITRSILMLGSVLFYLGFLLPKRLEKWFLKL
ncbi:MAG: hypothetical protein EU549_05290 [Promethearchaeota archaeon]|nr:MAG: hypothetical protein EU549_05290 [Candidatus Lokiarchaeota archaeon]